MKGKLGMVKRELRELGSRSTFKKIFHYTLSSAFSRIWRPWNKTFTCFGINFEYVVTPRSFDNERSVEIPVVQSFIKHTTGKSVLEIGNVLFNYQQPPAEVVDKFEKRPWVINQDIVDFSPGKQYDLIVSISTIEHVGLDEPVKESNKCVRALKKIKNLLAPDGQAIIAIPIGYNIDLDNFVTGNQEFFDKLAFLKRTSYSNKWVETEMEDAISRKYSERFPYANAEAFLILRR